MKVKLPSPTPSVDGGQSPEDTSLSDNLEPETVASEVTIEVGVGGGAGNKSEDSVLRSTQKKSGSSIQKKKKGSSSTVRCEHCSKRLGVACRYVCRCGKVFCTIHRYPEEHSCSFDYKAEGKKIIAAANPLIEAKKIDEI